MPTDTQADITQTLEKTNSLLRRYVGRREAFIRGILTGLGGSLGATAVLAIILWTASQLAFVPIVGNFATEVIKFINQNSPISPSGQ